MCVCVCVGGGGGGGGGVRSTLYGYFCTIMVYRMEISYFMFSFISLIYFSGGVC